MRILTLQFSAKVYTNLGEQIFLCGNVPELGNWQPCKGLKLYTDANMYPTWSSFRFIHIRQSTLLEFKVCIVTYHGQVIRWENLACNGNRRIVVSMNMAVFFQEGVEDLQISRIDPTPRISCRKKTLEILNDLDSDSSSSKEFWKDYMDEDQDTPAYYRNFVCAMRRLIESQSQQETPLRFNEQTTYLYSSIIEHSVQYQPENYFIIFHSGSDKRIPQNSLAEKSNNRLQNTIYLRNQEAKQTAEKIKYLANAIVSGKQFILVAHLYLKSKKIQGSEILLKMSLQWKTVVHIPKDLIGESLKIIEYGVNMIVLQDQESLKKVFSLLNATGYRLKMVKPLLYVLELYHYRQTYIYCSTCSHEEFIEDSKIGQKGEYGDKIKRINELLFMNPHFPTQMALMKSLTDSERSIFHKVKYGKRVIVITTNSVKSVSQKVINLLINIAGRRNHEVYFIQEQKLTGIEKYIPITGRDRMMVVNSAGQIYASGQRTPTLYQNLSLSPRRVQQMYDTLIKAVGADSHCQIKTTKKNTLLIQFTADEIGQCVKKFITDSVIEMNVKSLAKLIIVNKDQPNTIQIKPYCTSTDFYLKSIVNAAFKVESYSKNLFLCIDYHSEERSLNLIQKILKNADNILYQGFYCQKVESSYTNLCRPMIAETNLCVLLETLIEESLNAPWLRSPSLTTQTDVQ